MAIELRGTYRYATRGQLELALSRAQALIDDDGPTWMRGVERAGVTLRVHTTLPLVADHYVTAAVLEALATCAIERSGFAGPRSNAERCGGKIDGVVEATRDGRCVDWFVSRA